MIDQGSKNTSTIIIWSEAVLDGDVIVVKLISKEEVKNFVKVLSWSEGKEDSVCAPIIYAI